MSRQAADIVRWPESNDFRLPIFFIMKRVSRAPGTSIKPSKKGYESYTYFSKY